MQKVKGEKDMPANEMLKRIREKSEMLEIDRKFLSRSLNEGFSGGEKKRTELNRTEKSKRKSMKIIIKSIYPLLPIPWKK